MIKGLCHQERNKERTICYYKPNVERWKHYNMHIQHAINRESLCLQSFSTVLQEAADRHLEKVPHDANGQPCRTKIIDNNFDDESTFTISELNDALQAAKCNKQPGPDGVIIELLKWLDAPNRDILLQLINSWWSNKAAPELDQIKPLLESNPS